MTAIPASAVTVRSLVDGTLRATIDIEPSHAKAAFAFLCKPGQPLGVAPLKTSREQAAEERPKGGEAAKWLGMRCQEPEFLAWLAAAYPRAYNIASGALTGVDNHAAEIVRQLCNVESRADIDNDPRAFADFDRLIRRPWLAHTKDAA